MLIIMDLINIDDIVVGDRFRKSPGDVSDLINSIEVVGLLHPVVIDGDYNLIAGHRRLIALKKMGETSVPCTIVDLPRKDKRRAEAEENTARMDFTNSEIYAIQQYFHETESKPGERTDLQPLSESDRSVEHPRDKAARATGKSTDTISKINQVMDAESDSPIVQKKLDEIKGKIDEQSVDKSYKQVKDLVKPQEDRPDPEFLVKLFVDLIKKQDDTTSIFSDLFDILQYPDGAKLLKSRISRYKK